MADRRVEAQSAAVGTAEALEAAEAIEAGVAAMDGSAEPADGTAALGFAVSWDGSRFGPFVKVKGWWVSPFVS